MTTDACPTCGNTRTDADHGPGWTVWLCPFCGASREEVEAE